MSSHSVRIRQVERFKFEIDFGDNLPKLQSDEPEPIGGGEGPSPEQLLVAGVTNCLCASLVFALGKFHQDAGGVSAEAQCVIGRNEEGRLRVHGIDVALAVDAPQATMPRLDRVLDQFQRFCTVSESVRAGIPIAVTVRDSDGRTVA